MSDKDRQNLTEELTDFSDFKKSMRIMDYLDELGYCVLNELECVTVIDKHHIDISMFPLPYGAETFEEYKTAVLEQEKELEKIRNRPVDKNNTMTCVERFIRL